VLELKAMQVMRVLQDLKDLQDLIANLKYFLYLGPRPALDRWAYWEKFDFLAVFWGMFAIGLSGLMLWFPEWFATFVPGWAFNLATIVHSDEALLATGFIFTVHFFNTHFRPEKMPMDTVIFNGRVSEEEMMEERGDQIKRYEVEGVPADMFIETPRNVLWEFFFRIFGLLAVAIGLGLAAVMFTSLMSGH
jgi:cytochrome b subunit of formate dehydrogenase